MRILGISAFYHDSAAALVEDGRIVAAAQEERFTRKKHDASFPTHAVEYCLHACGGRLAPVDFIAFYDKPFLKFERLLETYLAFAPRGFTSFSTAMPVWLREKLFQKALLKKRLRAYAPSFDWERRLLFTEHHQSHAASAFFASPFEEAVVLTMDGVGEWATTSVSLGRGHHLEMRKEIHFPHSLGLLYSAFTYYTGFKVNSGEYKVMGLAPYGEPRFAPRILEELIDLKPDGSFRLNLSYFDYCTGLRMTNRRFEQLFEGPPRRADELLTQRHLDLAASIQAVTEEVVLRLTRAIGAETGAENLCLAPSVLREDVADWFDLDDDSPYMLLVAGVAPRLRREMTPAEQRLFGIEKLNVPRSSIPAVTHVDYSARIQTVHRATNARYHELLTAFKKRTGCPVLVNTSFNVRGEPIVCTPEDAFRCFMGTDIELLVAENCLLRKEDQDPRRRRDYQATLALD
jgi:carbamoyltransferase